MDKDILRIIILAIGGILVLGIYLWDRVKNRRAKRRPRARSADDFNDLEDFDLNPSDEMSEEFDLEGIGSAVDELDIDRERALFSEKSEPETEVPERDLPELIQFAVVARDGGSFSGAQLVDSLEGLGLRYGEMNIYHRYDNGTGNRLYSIASMVEPGTFPEEDLEAFRCPGLIFFMQPRELALPLDAFDDLVRTVHEVSSALGAEEWDSRRQPLTVHSIETIRASLCP